MTDESVVFIPALAVVLTAAEDRKGSPLDPDDVLRIRDSAPCMRMPAEVAAAMSSTRGADLDPENLWFDWQMHRRAEGRLPDLDPGPRLVPAQGVDFTDAVAAARGTLTRFRTLVAALPPGATAMVKARVADGDEAVNMWTIVVADRGDSFDGELFEVPPTLGSFAAHDVVSVPDAELLDWMVNDDGAVEGGFSLRVDRARLADDDARAEFDSYVGARVWR